MKLPNGERAIADWQKLFEYCLNPHHPRGRNKARVFAAVGIHQGNVDLLRDAILFAAATAEAHHRAKNPYGDRYVVDFDLPVQERVVKVRSTWIVRTGEDVPRLTSCYLL
jgi:hypothetical protein